MWLDSSIPVIHNSLPVYKMSASSLVWNHAQRLCRSIQSFVAACGYVALRHCLLTHTGSGVVSLARVTDGAVIFAELEIFDGCLCFTTCFSVQFHDMFVFSPGLWTGHLYRAPKMKHDMFHDMFV